MSTKKTLRAIYLRLRKDITNNEKNFLDDNLTDIFLNSSMYKLSKNILTYVSINFEVDTRKIIEQAFKDGKNVYVPYCTKEKCVMNFYKITSIDALKQTKFGTFEPVPDEQKLYVKEDSTICIVPGLVFDKNGYRIGYGGGYYDFYLNHNTILTIGLIYEKFLIDNILKDDYDERVNILLTNKKIYYIY
ncbi:MAG: 5-formyltetrahydrofolate cyclo-ligase [Lachnospirales bacterium]